MISLLGPPPLDILPRGGSTSRFFEKDGTAFPHGLPLLVIRETLTNSPTPGTFKFPDLLSDVTLESEEENLEGEEKDEFLAFIRKTLQWRPEDRASASDLLKDPWLGKMRGG